MIRLPSTIKPSTILIAALALGLLLPACRPSQTDWLCEPTWDLWPGKAHREAWAILPGSGKAVRERTASGIDIEIYPDAHPATSGRQGYQTRRIAGFNPRSGRLFTGYLNHGPAKAIAKSRALSEHYRRNPVLPREQVEFLNRLHATTGISAEEAGALLRRNPDAGIPAGDDLHAWWKSHQHCKRTHALRFWPEAVLRALGAGCAAMG